MIPEIFSERMKKMLGENYADFEAALAEENVRGVRVNTAKISVERKADVIEFSFGGKTLKLNYNEKTRVY